MQETGQLTTSCNRLRPYSWYCKPCPWTKQLLWFARLSRQIAAHIALSWLDPICSRCRRQFIASAGTACRTVWIAVLQPNTHQPLCSHNKMLPIGIFGMTLKTVLTDRTSQATCTLTCRQKTCGPQSLSVRKHSTEAE
jgi:hypothetical protein